MPAKSAHPYNSDAIAIAFVVYGQINHSDFAEIVPCTVCPLYGILGAQRLLIRT